jgi:hypothetical protein
VWVPYHPYLAVMAGKPTHAHGMALVELLWGQGPVVDQLHFDVEQAIAARRFGAIVLDPVWFPPELKTVIEANYPMRSPMAGLDEVFFPVTGMRTRPETIARPR